MSFLGLNVGINHKKSASWANLIDRIKRRLANWNDKNISFAGRITLIQAILSIIPIYSLFFYRILKIKPLESLIIFKDLFYRVGVRTTKKKVRECLCIKNLFKFNSALLGKWIWRFLNEPNYLWAKIIYSRYGGFVERESSINTGNPSIRS